MNENSFCDAEESLFNSASGVLFCFGFGFSFAELRAGHLEYAAAVVAIEAEVVFHVIRRRCLCLDIRDGLG